MEWIEEFDGTSWALWDGFCRARISKLRTGFWMGEIFEGKQCVGHELSLENAKAACENKWVAVREEVAKRETCPRSYDQAVPGELPGEHPRVYCRFGCGCWVYASPFPIHQGCSGFCNLHPSADCTTYICALPGCRSLDELKKASEIERLPERTPEENKKLFEMLDALEKEAGNKN